MRAEDRVIDNQKTAYYYYRTFARLDEKRQRMKQPITTSLKKCRTGIAGLDELTGGGLPAGRPTLVCGAAGCGKTVLAMQFLVQGAREYGEPGVFVSFEESIKELTTNFASLGYDLAHLANQKKLAFDYVYIERSEIEETGEYNLEGLFIRLEQAVRSVGAKRIVLDTIEALFAGLANTAILRAELRRLFAWLKARGLTAVITAEKGGDGTITRYGLEEYVADCVLILDNRMSDQLSTRRMRILKYRGSEHAMGEYPFLITNQGVSILPITSLGLNNPASRERISSGIPQLDAMLGGPGFYRGSSIVVTGTAGVGKTSLAAHFVQAACRKNTRCLWLAFEESPDQITRNMAAIGIDFKPALKKGVLRIEAARSTSNVLEDHLMNAHRLIGEFRPEVVVVDPISNLGNIGDPLEVKSVMVRLIDFFKNNLITTMFTSLTHGGHALENTDLNVSSMMDVWILLRDIESSGERNRGLYVIKARGLAHSNQIREFLITDHGIRLIDVYLGAARELLTGTARAVFETREKNDLLALQQVREQKKRNLENKQKLLEAQIKALQAEYDDEVGELKRTISQENLARQDRGVDQAMINRLRRSVSRARPVKK